MRLRSRGNQPEHAAPDQLPAQEMTERPAGEMAEPPAREMAEPPARSAGVAPEPATKGVPEPVTDAGAQPGPEASPGPLRVAAPTQRPQHHAIHRTRVGGVWVGMGLTAVVLLLLLVFILENQQSANIGYFGMHGHLPLGVALLLAALAGALLVLIPGSARIMQLRKTARRHRRLDAAAHQAGSPQHPSGPPNPRT